MASPQTLRETERRLLAPWAVACAERVLSLFDAEEHSEQQIQEALARAKAYGNDESSSAAEIAKRLVAVKVAKGASTAAGRASGRAVGQAAAVAHMGAHALGAAAYAVKAIALAHPDRPEAVEEEIRAALRRLPPLGSDSAGPLGPGLLSRGILGDVIRELQKRLAG